MTWGPSSCQDDKPCSTTAEGGCGRATTGTKLSRAHLLEENLDVSGEEYVGSEASGGRLRSRLSRSETQCFHVGTYLHNVQQHQPLSVPLGPSTRQRGGVKGGNSPDVDAVQLGCQRRGAACLFCKLPPFRGMLTQLVVEILPRAGRQK